MNIILGANGQIGSHIINELRGNHQPVTAVVRDKKKGATWNNIQVRMADIFDEVALKEAFSGGHTVFLLTPENPSSKNVVTDTKIMLHNYRKAVEDSGVKRIVGLSSMGAQHPSGTGNLVMSYLLEHAFEDLPIEQVFIRPAFYYSNWLGYLDTVKAHGILPTFFPIDMKIPMVAPWDVAKFIARVMMNEHNDKKIYELAGPKFYSSSDVANAFGKLYEKKVTAQAIPQTQWKENLMQVGFSENAAQNLIQMTQAVIDGKTLPENEGENLVKLDSDFNEYISKL